MTTAETSALLAGAVFTLALLPPMLRRRRVGPARQTLSAFSWLAFGGVLSFVILVLGEAPRPMAGTTWWLHKTGVVLGASFSLAMAHRYGPCTDHEPIRFLSGLLAGMTAGVLFHWVAPAGTDTYATAAAFTICGSACGLMVEWRLRRGASTR